MKKAINIGLILFFITIAFFACKTENKSSQENLATQELKLDSLLASKNSEANNELRQELKKMMQNKDEHVLLKALDYYLKLDITNQEMDSLDKVVVKRFPEGIQARFFEHGNIFNANSAKEQEKMYDEWIKKFPPKKFSINDRNLYSNTLSYIIAKYIEEKNIKEAKACVSKFVDSPINAVSYYSIAAKFYSEGLFSEAKLYLDKSLDSEKKWKNVKYLPKNDKEILNTTHTNSLNLYANLYVKQNDFEKAAKYFKEYKEALGFLDAESCILYAKSLIALGKKEIAFSELEELVKENRANNEVKTLFKRLFLEIKGTENDFEKYEVSLEQKKQKDLAQEATKTIINEPAPKVILRDGDGNKVSLEDLKGHILVLDFWATWCTPCKKSFPAVQSIMKDYKDDLNIKFLFIDTFEMSYDAATIKKVTTYLKSKNYNFDMYYDTKSEESGSDELSSAFGITAIPAKFIIDKKGNIRYRIIGYEGNLNDEKVKIEAMIEMVKKE